MKILIFLAALLVASALQAAPYEGDWLRPYEGKWGPENFFCDVSSGDESFMSLQERSLSDGQDVLHCDFNRIQRTGSKFAIDMTCDFEGADHYKDRMVFEMLGPDRMSVWKKSLGKRPVQTLVRCPVPDGEQIPRMLNLWEKADAACRATADEEACEQSQFLHLWLSGTAGNAVCFGKEGEAEAQRRWHKCTPQSIRPDSRRPARE
ncbi:hypothetical protein [Microvirga sp. P5_D2]